MTPSITEFTPHLGQQFALDSEARFIATITGLQGGKTTVGALWFLREIWNKHAEGKHGNWLIAAPTVGILDQSTLPKLKEFFPSDWGVWKEQKRCFELSPALGGGFIFVRSTDEPDHLEGMTVLGAWIDEAGQIDYNAWVNIQGRLSINRGRALMTTTPYIIGWMSREIEKKAGLIIRVNDQEVVDREVNPEGDRDIEIFKWVSVNNPVFPREEYKRAERTLPPEIFRRRYQGEFTRMEGLVYKDFDRKTHVVPAFPIPGTWKRFSGLDFGHTNPTAVLCIAQKPEVAADKDKGIEFEPSKFYVYREFYKTGALLNDVAHFLKSEPLSYVLADPAGAQQIDELVRFYGVKRVTAAENKIDIGIERIIALLREGRLFFLDGRCPHAVDEIEQYHYKFLDPDKPNNDKPVAVNNHAMDALKYAFSRVLEGLYAGQTARYSQYKAYVRNLQTVPQGDSFTGYF